MDSDKEIEIREKSAMDEYCKSQATRPTLEAHPMMLLDPSQPNHSKASTPLFKFCHECGEGLGSRERLREDQANIED